MEANKAKANETKDQSQVNKDQISSTAGDQTTQAWCGARFQRNFNGKQSKEKLELARNIRGDSHTSKLANVPAHGEVWFDEKAITNILSFVEMKVKYRITFDSFNEKAFVMHYSHKKSNFVAVKN